MTPSQHVGVCATVSEIMVWQTLWEIQIVRVSAGSPLACSYGDSRYLNFCTHLNLSPLPLDQDTVMQFVAHLAQSGMACQSIWTYLHITSGLPDPHLNTFPRLEYVLWGILQLPATNP